MVQSIYTNEEAIVIKLVKNPSLCSIESKYDLIRKEIVELRADGIDYNRYYQLNNGRSDINEGLTCTFAYNKSIV
jgi:hypothetical protein